MTYSFRRRHDTWDSAHERARYRAAERVDGLIDPDEEAWLDAHLAECAACRAVADEYEAQHNQLRAFRSDLPQPPRDLWARTAAAIEREAATSGAARRSRSRRSSAVPIGALSGLLVVAVVVGAAFLSRRATPPISPPGSLTAREPSPASFVVPKRTPMPVTADVDYVKLGDGGSKLYQARITEVCSEKDGSDCPAIPESSPVAVTLPSKPESVIRSPTKKEIIVISTATAANGASLTLVPVPADSTAASPSPASPTPSPTTSATTSESPSPTPPEGPVDVLTDRVFDATAAYTPDGTWFAFSARPSDGSHGPDVYVIRAGETQPTALTSDHRSVFASWLGNVVIASRSTATETDGSSSDPPSSVEAETVAIDPATGASATVVASGLWRPTVDPNHERAVYWTGTLEREATGTAVRPALGSLVIGPFPRFDPATLSPRNQIEQSASPDASDEAASSESPSANTAEPSATTEPSGLASPSATRSATGDVQELKSGPIIDWDARWDETGTHLAVWIADAADRSFGRLSLYVIDPATGKLEADDQAIKGVPALPGFSIGKGRLAYATPPGQDGKGSSVRVQAWTASGIGEGETDGAHEQVIIVR
jgi:hypothetical protein